MGNRGQVIPTMTTPEMLGHVGGVWQGRGQLAWR